MTTLGFAFSGCSGRVSFHLGAARQLQQLGVKPTVVTGSSSGSLAAGATAIDRLDAIYDSWRLMLSDQVLYQPHRLLRGRWPMTMSHILRRGLTMWFGDRLLRDVPIAIGIPVTTIGLRGRFVRTLTNSDPNTLSDAIAASCFIPGIYSRMVAIDRRITLDGAWMRRTPTDEALGLGADKLIAFVATPSGQLTGGLRKERVFPLPPNVRVLHPATELPTRGFDFNQGKLKRCFSLGEEAAQRFVEANQDWLGDVTD
jgi:NTE family protein